MKFRLILLFTFIMVNLEDCWSHPKFNAIWLEPFNFMFPREKIEITPSDVEELLRKYKELGIETIIVAYTEFLGHFFYQSSIDREHPCYIQEFSQSRSEVHSTLEQEGVSWRESTMNPSKACESFFKYCNGNHFLSSLFSAADGLGLKIILGLGRSEDWMLLVDIERNLKNTSLVIEKRDLNQRLSNAIVLSKEMANELYLAYGQHQSFYGWYLAHETSYHDIGLNYYKPVGKYLKEKDPTKLIMISPSANYIMGYSDKSLKESLEESNFIDIIALQDGIGAGYLASEKEYRYTADSRQRRLEELRLIIPKLRDEVESSGKQFWYMLESWHMDGPKYGWPKSGAFEDRVKEQLIFAAGQSNVIILNEGLIAFDFGLKSFELLDQRVNQAAKQFTDEYLKWVGLSRMGISNGGGK